MASATPGLHELQRAVLSALLVPLGRRGRLCRGSKEVRAAVEFIRPNSRLTAFDRLEIYSRSYWSRVLDSLRDDFPGLAMVLGETGFQRLARSYLSACPSERFTLRDLGSRLETWLGANPEQAGRNMQLALDMVRLEWAHIEAFDSMVEPALCAADLEGVGPLSRLRPQPGIGLLKMQYPVDELKIQTNAAGDDPALLVQCRKRAGSMKRTKQKALYLAVHNSDLSVYYRRLVGEEFLLLQALRQGRSIRSAISAAFIDTEVAPNSRPGLVQTWFARWAELGWLCPESKRNQ